MFKRTKGVQESISARLEEYKKKNIFLRIQVYKFIRVQ